MEVMTPLMIDLAHRRMVIFGGGKVAARKAAYFVDQGPVRVVSRSFAPGFGAMGVEKIDRDLDGLTPEEIGELVEGAFLVIGATPHPEINDRIGEVCRERGILYNSAEGSPGDVILPAVLEGEHFVVAVSTGGMSPAFSRYLRASLESHREEYDRMVELQERLRSALRAKGGQQADRAEILNRVVEDPRVWELLRTDPEAAWEAVREEYLP